MTDDNPTPKIFKHENGALKKDLHGEDNRYINITRSQAEFAQWYQKQGYRTGYMIGESLREITLERDSHDTHRILFRTEPLEEEKIEMHEINCRLCNKLYSSKYKYHFVSYCDDCQVKFEKWCENEAME